MFLSLLLASLQLAILVVAGADPDVLNEVRFASPDALLEGSFDVYLEAESGDGACYTPTPKDVMGPFYVEPSSDPDVFPNEDVICAPRSNCDNCEPNHHYTSGLPLRLYGNVFSAATCEPIPNAKVEFWQADPNGMYWAKDNVWNRRVLLESTDDKPFFNCRAYLISGSSGNYSFKTLVPGHYVAGSSWRPRHIHAKISARGYKTIVSQVYFHGDPFLGDKDTACSVCKSDHPDLISYLSCNGTPFSLNALETQASASGNACAVRASTPTLSSRAPTLSPTVSSSHSCAGRAVRRMMILVLAVSIALL